MANTGRNNSGATLHHGLFRFFRMLFELRKVPGIFRRTMDLIFSPINWHFALVYLNDINIIYQHASQHISHVRTVWLLLHKTGITLNLKEGSFLTERNFYLEHVIRLGKVELPDHSNDTTGHLKPPGPCN